MILNLLSCCTVAGNSWIRVFHDTRVRMHFKAEWETVMVKVWLTSVYDPIGAAPLDLSLMTWTYDLVLTFSKIICVVPENSQGNHTCVKI